MRFRSSEYPAVRAVASAGHVRLHRQVDGGATKSVRQGGATFSRCGSCWKAPPPARSPKPPRNDESAQRAFESILAEFERVEIQEPSPARRDRFYELTEAYDQAIIRYTRNKHLARQIAELRPHSLRLRIIAQLPAQPPRSVPGRAPGDVPGRRRPRRSRRNGGLHRTSDADPANHPRRGHQPRQLGHPDRTRHRLTPRCGPGCRVAGTSPGHARARRTCGRTNRAACLPDPALEFGMQRLSPRCWPAASSGSHEDDG